MAWPFLSAVASGGSAGATGVPSALHTTVATTQMPTAAQQILLAPRGIPRRRYFSSHENLSHFKINQLTHIDTSTPCHAFPKLKLLMHVSHPRFSNSIFV